MTHSLDWTPCAKDAAGWQDATVPNDACSAYLRSVGFDPQPKQYDFITCPADDVGFGGARGGAKTAGIIGDWLWHEKQYGESAIGFVFRRERTQLMEFIEEAKRFFLSEHLKFKWQSIEKTFIAPSGARLRAAYLDKDTDADAYQGGGATRVYIEERGTFPREPVLNKLQAILRSGRGVPCQMKSTFNPGGVGHLHCKERYRLHDAIPKGYEFFNTVFENPWTKEKISKSRIFIPSRLSDNKYLGNDYVANLYEACAGNDALLQAWLEGRWDIIEGAFFNAWTGQHVIPPFEIPQDWNRFRSVKWGSARPLSVGWWAVAGTDHRISAASGDEQSVSDIFVPRGALVRYREWYAQKGKGTNEGLKLTGAQIAQGIKDRTPRDERIAYTVASPQIFESDFGPSIAERMLQNGVYPVPADDHSAKELGHSGGWDELRARLVGRDGVPAIFCFTNCADSVRTIPALQHDAKQPEEIDGESETAAADDWRFAAMSRPWIPYVPPPPIPDGIGLYGDANGVTRSTLTIRQMIDRMEKKRRAEAE